MRRGKKVGKNKNKNKIKKSHKLEFRIEFAPPPGLEFSSHFLARRIFPPPLPHQSLLPLPITQHLG